MKKVFCSLFIYLFVIGCSPSPAAIQKAIEQTQTAQPTPTRISFDQVDIQGILLQQGDLPSDYEFGQVKYDWPIDTGLPNKVAPDNLILQMFKEKGDSLNIPHFSLFALYNDKLNADSSYNEIIKTFDFENVIPSVAGDKNSIMHYKTGTDLLTFDATLFVFQRCNSLVVIRVFNIADDVIFSYAKGLDKRIEKIACQ